MKSLSETIQDVETKKRQLEENVDMLNEKLTAASAAGKGYLARENLGPYSLTS